MHTEIFYYKFYKLKNSVTRKIFTFLVTTDFYLTVITSSR